MTQYSYSFVYPHQKCIPKISMRTLTTALFVKTKMLETTQMSIDSAQIWSLHDQISNESEHTITGSIMSESQKTNL